MKNKKVLVIGAGSYSRKDPLVKGIGTCLVERLAKEQNISILFTYNKSKEGAKKLIDKIRTKYSLLVIDCFRFNAINYAYEWKEIDAKLSDFGTSDVFVYNAGLRYYKESLSNQEKLATMQVNYYCPVFLIEKIAEKMIQDKIKGKIILISSILAGKHHQFLEDYCLSKGLLVKYVQDNLEYWKTKGIDINIISPTVTRTPMTEDRINLYELEAKQGKRPKITSPEEIAEIITIVLSH